MDTQAGDAGLLDPVIGRCLKHLMFYTVMIYIVMMSLCILYNRTAVNAVSPTV